MQKNDCFTVPVEDLNNLGFGVAHAEGKTLFVSGAVDGDVCRVRVMKCAATWAACRTEEVLEPSPHRIRNDCPAAGCGGCAYRQVDYAHEKELKRRYVEFCFRKAGVQATVLPVEGRGGADGYRNKAQYAFGTDSKGTPVLGFFAPKSHRVVPAERCPLQPPVFTRTAQAVLEYVRERGLSVYDEQTGRGLLRHLYLRSDSRGGVLLTLVLNGSVLPDGEGFVARMRAAVPALLGILLNENRENTNVVLGQRYFPLWGRQTLTDTLCGVELEIAPDAFYQVNHDAAEHLYRKAAQLADLQGTETLADLYCGAGSIGLFLAPHCREVVGVEIVPEAVENARQNALRNGIANARFLLRDAGDPSSFFTDLHPDTVVIDPPRKGTTPALIAAIANEGVRKVVYVSCAADTLARDAALFLAHGYTLSPVTPVDLFPRTGHVETVVLLSRETNPLTVEVRMEVETGEVKEHPTYKRIQEYVLEKYGFKVHTAYIAEVKRMVGLDMHKAPNAVEQRKHEYHPCPPEKVEAIKDALRHFGLIAE